MTSSPIAAALPTYDLNPYAPTPSPTAVGAQGVDDPIATGTASGAAASSVATAYVPGDAGADVGAMDDLAVAANTSGAPTTGANPAWSADWADAFSALGLPASAQRELASGSYSGDDLEQIAEYLQSDPTAAASFGGGAGSSTASSTTSSLDPDATSAILAGSASQQPYVDPGMGPSDGGTVDVGTDVGSTTGGGDVAPAADFSDARTKQFTALFQQAGIDPATQQQLLDQLGSSGLSDGDLDALATQLSTDDGRQEFVESLYGPGGVPAAPGVGDYAKALARPVAEGLGLALLGAGAFKGGAALISKARVATLEQAATSDTSTAAQQAAARAKLDKLRSPAAADAQERLGLSTAKTEQARYAAGQLLARDGKPVTARQLTKLSTADLASRLGITDLTGTTAEAAILAKAGDEGLTVSAKAGATAAGVRAGSGSSAVHKSALRPGAGGFDASGMHRSAGASGYGAWGEADAVRTSTNRVLHPIERLRAVSAAAKVSPTGLATDAARSTGTSITKAAATGFAKDLAIRGGASAEVVAGGGGSAVAAGLKGIGTTALKSGAVSKAGAIGAVATTAFEVPGIIDSYKAEGGFGEKTSEATGKAVGDGVGTGVGWIAGAEVGAAFGASFGSVIPGVGTAVGGVVGGLVGGFVGSYVGQKTLGFVGSHVGGGIHDAVNGAKSTYQHAVEDTAKGIAKDDARIAKDKAEGHDVQAAVDTGKKVVNTTVHAAEGAAKTTASAVGHFFKGLF